MALLHLGMILKCGHRFLADIFDFKTKYKTINKFLM